MDKVALVSYRPIGVVECSINQPLRPEIIRAVESRLVLEARFEPAVAALKIGQHLLVIYHLHQADPCSDHTLPQLFTRRIANRPNPIGMTLTRIVSCQGSVITVVGLDAMHGSPILDIKPYQPIFDAPPVRPAEYIGG